MQKMGRVLADTAHLAMPVGRLLAGPTPNREPDDADSDGDKH